MLIHPQGFGMEVLAYDVTDRVCCESGHIAGLAAVPEVSLHCSVDETRYIINGVGGRQRLEWAAISSPRRPRSWCFK